MASTATPPDQTDRERAALDLWAALSRVTATVRSRLAERLDADLGILPEEADLLLRLEESPEQRLRMADVSRLLRMSKSGVTRLVDRLVERGLVVRAACPSDRRVVYAGLTEDGRREAAQAALVLRAGTAEELGARFDSVELAALTASLQEILAAELART